MDPPTSLDSDAYTVITVSLTATFSSMPLPKECMTCRHYSRNYIIFLSKIFPLRDKVIKFDSTLQFANRKDCLITTDSFVGSLMILLHLSITLYTCMPVSTDHTVVSQNHTMSLPFWAIQMNRNQGFRKTFTQYNRNTNHCEASSRLFV